jgi:potassium-transporting ATPase potassium-binding subunit
MTTYGAIQLALFFAVLLAAVKPLGSYMARVFQGERTFLDPVLRPIERLLYRLGGVREHEEYGWKENAKALLIFNAIGFLAVYALQRFQQILPLNPEALPAVREDTAFNTAISFVTNTNWQAYAGESTMSYLTQMLALTVQNFLSAATGMAVLALFIRGIARHSSATLGSFWVDMTRSTLYILLPCSLVLAPILVSQGVVQNFTPHTDAHPVEAHTPQRVQAIPGGPVASQIAIKQLGTNGGGYFNANSAHPFENPTPLSNMLEMLAILLLPAALCYTFGRMVQDTRQGWAILAAMLIIFIPAVLLTAFAEQGGNPITGVASIDQASSDTQPGGNMEGKEMRIGIANSALWATATTAASNGSVNSMHASYTPIGAAVQLVMMQLGEVVFGGVGSGLYGLLAFVIVAVFVSGLLVGRTPEYLGHKLEAYEMKMVSLLILIMPMIVLTLTALALMLETGRGAMLNAGPRGFTEVLYAFTSTANNNGSAFAGLNANIPFYNIAGGIAMFIGRYFLAVPTLALAGALAQKKRVPPGSGTLPTHTALFIGWVVAIVLVVGALNFFPALALGPIVEHLMIP